MTVEENVKKYYIKLFYKYLDLNADYHFRLLELWESLPAPCRFPLLGFLEEILTPRPRDAIEQKPTASAILFLANESTKHYKVELKRLFYLENQI